MLSFKCLDRKICTYIYFGWKKRCLYKYDNSKKVNNFSPFLNFSLLKIECAKLLLQKKESSHDNTEIDNILRLKMRN